MLHFVNTGWRVGNPSKIPQELNWIIDRLDRVAMMTEELYMRQNKMW